ncbi:hypothetical protein ACCD00_25195 [Pseudomonas sp. Pseusp3]|uniref:hypothetical protein n=1 Tax=Pseudomonas sp. Pseusp3 TaxID=3243029 RepID=UPI0039B05FA1
MMKLLCKERLIARISIVLLGILVSLVSQRVVALDVNITALFRPDPANPLKNEFINTTPQSGYCEALPQYCVNPPLISFRLPMRFRSAFPIKANHPVQSDGAMFGVPGQWRTLQVRHVSTGEMAEVEVRVAGIGTTHLLETPVKEIVGVPESTSSATAFEMLWEGGGWVHGAGPCKSTGYHGSNSWMYGFFLSVDATDGVCAKKALFEIPVLKYDHLDLGYELRTPNPLKMATGVYVGSIIYTIGPRGDIDMGNNMVAEGSSVINLMFTLTVEHELKVELPPGGNKISLVPQGGWQSWLQAGRKPVRLFRDQTFNISASSRFKMHLECEFSAFPHDCLLDDRVSKRGVALHVGVSLPNGLTDMAGQPVRQMRLRAGAANALQFQPGFYVDRAPGVLHFEVPPDQMEFMLKPGAGPFYRGNATVIWDSEV